MFTIHCIYGSPPVILYLSLALTVLHYSPSFLVAAVTVELSPGPVSVVFSPIAVASASPAPEEVDGVFDKLLYYLLVCFCHLFSVFVVHTCMRTQINFFPSLPAIVLVTCAQCTHMLTTLLIVGCLLLILFSIQGTTHTLLLGRTAPPDSPHVDLAVNCNYTCNCIKYLMALCVCFSMSVLRSLQSYLIACYNYQLYLISPTPVVPAAVDRFDIEVLSLANTSSLVITFSVSTPQACMEVCIVKNIICMSLSSSV